MNTPVNGVETADTFVGELAGVGGTPSPAGASFGEEDEEASSLVVNIFSHNAIKHPTGERLEIILDCLLLV